MTTSLRPNQVFAFRVHQVFITLLVALLITPLSSNVNAAKVAELRSIEGISEYALDNGLQVLLFPDQSKDTITVNITYHVGSKHENYGETGMAHLLEHLLFRGTKKHPQLSQEISQRGATANGTTSLERTNYYQTLKAGDDNLKWAISMEADRMVNSIFDQEDLDSEMTVVRNELERSENSPGMILYQRVNAVAFDWHNYGNPTIGARSDIENVKIENLRSFYRNYYQPDNATLIIAGKFDQRSALKYVKQYFGKIKRPKRQLPAIYTLEPTQDGERSVVLRRVGGKQILLAAYRIPSGVHPDYAALSLLAVILGDSPSGRLHKNLVESRLATSVWAWPNQQQESSLIYFNVSVDAKGDMDSAQKALLNVLEVPTNKLFTNEELERAKRKAAKDMEMAFSDTQSLAINLSEWIGMGDWRTLFLYRDQINTVTLEDINRVANTYLIASNRTLGKFIPEEKPVRAEIPLTPDIPQAVENYQSKSGIQQGEVFDATLDNIAAREIRLENDGIKVSLIPIKTRGESVFIEMRMGVGNEVSLQNKTSIRQFTARMLDKGTSRLTRQELQDEFDRLMTYGGFSSDEQGIYASFETKRDKMPQVLALLHEILTTANFPENEFELLKAQALSKLNADTSDPQALAFNLMAQQLSSYPKGHLHATASISEQIAEINSLKLEELTAFHKSHFGSSNMQFAFVGDFDTKAIGNQIFELFSNWNNAEPYHWVSEKFSKNNVAELSITTPDKKNSLFIAAKNININRQHPDAPALYVLTRILGGGFLDSRLSQRIRVTEGLSYTVNASLSLPIKNELARFYVYAISAPENSEKVHAAFADEMKRAYTKGFQKDEMVSAINGILDEAKVQRSDNASLAGSALRLLHAESNFLREKELQEKIKSLTVEQLNQVMRKYLAAEEMTIIKAGDF